MENKEPKKKKQWTHIHSFGVVAFLASVSTQVEAMQQFLGHDFANYVFKFLVAFGLVLFSFRKEMKKMATGLQNHVDLVDMRLSAMETSMNNVAVNVKDLKTALESVETKHSERIGKLESDVTGIKTKMGEK